MMDLATLQTFVAVARGGSFSGAADALFLTQPAVSRRIAVLEDELRAPLFDRIGRGVILTEAGESLLPHARRMIEEFESGRQAIADLAGTVGGRLRIGTSHHVGLHRLPPILRRYKAEFPGVELDLHFLDSEQACFAVERGELELAVVTLPETAADTLRCESLWHDPLDFVAAPDHPLASERELTANDLCAWPAILPGPNTFTRRIIAHALGADAVNLRIALETNYLETIKAMVAVGLGWSALPRTLNQGELTALATSGPRLQRQLGVVTRSGRTAPSAAAAFIALARDQACSDDRHVTGD